MKSDELEATVRESLAEAGVPPPAITQALKNLRAALEEEKADRTPKSKSKKQWAILVSDKGGSLKNVETVGWAFQIEEEAAPQCVLDRIHAAANSFNGSRKGKKHPVKTVGETCESVGGKHWKNENPTEKTSVKTKVPVVIQFVQNTLKTS